LRVGAMCYELAMDRGHPAAESAYKRCLSGAV
jgi:hypothetical protein